jgi:hypothetical protein
MALHADTLIISMLIAGGNTDDRYSASGDPSAMMLAAGDPSGFVPLVNKVEKALLRSEGFVLRNVIGNRSGWCGQTSPMVQYVAEQMGLRARNFQVAFLNADRGLIRLDDFWNPPSRSHGFSIVDGYIVDLSVDQFKAAENYPIGQELMEYGYARLTPESLTEYLDMLSDMPGPPVALGLLDYGHGEWHWTKEYDPGLMMKMFGE